MGSLWVKLTVWHGSGRLKQDVSAAKIVVRLLSRTDKANQKYTSNVECQHAGFVATVSEQEIYDRNIGHTNEDSYEAGTNFTKHASSNSKIGNDTDADYISIK